MKGNIVMIPYYFILCIIFTTSIIDAASFFNKVTKRKRRPWGQGKKIKYNYPHTIQGIDRRIDVIDAEIGHSRREIIERIETVENTTRDLYSHMREFSLSHKKYSINSTSPHKNLPPTPINNAATFWENTIKQLPILNQYKTELLEKVCSYKHEHESREKQNIGRYLRYVTQLPWNTSSIDSFDIQQAQIILDKNHYGLDTIKNGILRFIATQKLRQLSKTKTSELSPIFCLTGPPGTGKTSIVQSIATCLNRKFFRISVGGMTDEALIKGHSRTYVGSKPGYIIHGIKIAGTNNPVILIDEIDKMQRSSKSAENALATLLEVLDPEQNHSFLDHYLEIPYNLSRILFITTANEWNAIPKPLQDRMEKIEIAGYTAAEKLHIAQRHLLPALYKQSGLGLEKNIFNDALITKIITTHANQPGIRDLKRALKRLIEEQALAQVKNISFSITDQIMHFFLDDHAHINPRREIL
jgi:endopeptidase La